MTSDHEKYIAAQWAGSPALKPLDWDDDMGEWVCQAHGMYECSQLPECVAAFAAFNANHDGYINTRYDGLEPNGPNLWIIQHAKECTVEIDPADAETIGYDSNVPFGWCKECGEQVFSVRYLPYPQPSPIKRYPVTQPCGHSAGFTQHEPHEYIPK